MLVNSNNNNDDGVGGQGDDNNICLSSPNNLVDCLGMVCIAKSLVLVVHSVVLCNVSV